MEQTYWKDGISTLNDFNKVNKSQFVNDLIGKWEEIVLYNPILPKAQILENSIQIQIIG